MEEAKRKAQATYNAAAAYFDDSANAYWERYGRRTVERLELPPGSSVLDVARGLHHIDFLQDDMTQLPYNDESFDALVCVFGIFFVPDMEALVTELWRMVKPHGKLAITTWGPHLFEPMYNAFDALLKDERPDLVTDFRPWDRITTASAVEQLLRDGGTTNITTASEAGEQRLLDIDSWWKIALGSGLRATVEAMGPELAERVRLQNRTFIEEQSIRSITTNVIYGVAHKVL